MAYRHDVFLSYPHGFIEDWVRDIFLPLFQWHIEGALGYAPNIFYDRAGIVTGDSWPLRLKQALACSRCLVAIWAPSYFNSEWCMRECSVMLDRERQLKYRTVKNPSGLILPVNVSDGDSFPGFAKTIQYFDCRDYAIVGAGFTKTKRYVEFQLKLKSWAPEVAEVIKRAPQWKSKWLNDKMIKIPSIKVPSFKQPTLAE